MGDFSTLEHFYVFVSVRDGVYRSHGIIHSLIVCMGVSGNFVRLGERLCFGWEGGTFVAAAEESATSIPTSLQNDCGEMCEFLMHHFRVKIEFKQHLLTFPTVGYARGEFGI